MNPGIITKIRKNQKFIYYGLLLLAVIFLLCILLISSVTIRKERKARIEAYTDRAAAELDERIEGYLYSFMESNLDRYMRQSTFSLFFERDTDFEVDFFTPVSYTHLCRSAPQSLSQSLFRPQRYRGI